METWDRSRIRTTESLGPRMVGAAEFGPTRRTQRWTHAADALLRHPLGTRPDKFAHPADLQGFDRLRNRPDVTHETLLASARACTRQLVAEEPGVVLRLADGMSWRRRVGRF